MHRVALIAVGLAGLATVARAQEEAKPRPMPRGVVVQAATERFAVGGATIAEITQGLRSAHCGGPG